MHKLVSGIEKLQERYVKKNLAFSNPPPDSQEDSEAQE